MKTNKTLFALLSILLSVSSASAVGGRSDGGGNAVVCFDKKKNIVSAELYDLYEGRILRNWNPAPSKADAYDQAVDAAGRIVEGAGIGGQLEFEVRDVMEKYIKVLPAGNGVKPIKDATYIAVPKNCEIVQLASYQDDSNDLFVDGDIWKHLNATNQAALYVHEAVYSILRTQFNEMTSDHTRRAVSASFANIQFEHVEDGISDMPVQEVCETLGGEFLFNTKFDEKDHAIDVQFLSIGSTIIFAKTTAHFETSQEVTWPLSSNTYHSGSYTTLSSRVEKALTASIEFKPSNDNTYGSIKLSDSRVRLPFTCKVYTK